MHYRLATFDSGSDGPRAGVIVNDDLYDAAHLTGNNAYATVLGVLEDWDRADAAICQAVGGSISAPAVPVASAKLLAPILYPGQMYAAGANYQDHVDEMVRQGGAPPGPNFKEAGGNPWHYVKIAKSAVVGPGTRMPFPARTQKLDWEIELAVIIGRKARNVSVDDAMDYVAGFTIANDLSARDLNFRQEIPNNSPFHYDFVSGKNFDGACPMGPWIVPARDIADPMNLDMKLWIDGEIMQDSNTRHMIFDIRDQIAELSAKTTLHPGDVILTGTPHGVGMGRGFFLKPGQTMKLWIEGIGEMEHGLQ